MGDPYKDKLSPDAYRVCRLAATEQPFSGKYNDHWQAGTYVCTCCKQPLFHSSSKFDAGCGWPSFFQAIDDSIIEKADFSHNMQRIEIQCC